jgi:type I restriction enzyme S subunit
MGGEWLEEPFPDVIDFQEGPGILAKDFRDAGVPLVRLSGLERGASVLSGCNYLDSSTVSKRWSHFALSKGDVLLSTSASLGRIAVVGDDGVGAIPYTGIIRMRPRDRRLLPSFIRYLLEGPDFQRQTEVVGAGSVIRHFGPTHLRRMTVTLPPPSEQRAIAHILGTLDDKIELNRRMSETLEAMARALFKSWFVDFDPVRAKMAGRDPNLPKPLADLFPSRLVDSELGEIPAGWEVGTLTSLSALNPEGWTKNSRPAEIEYVDLANTKWGRIDAVTRHASADAPSRAQRILRPGDTIVGTVRPGNGSYALISRAGLTGSTGFAVLRPTFPTCTTFVYLAATSRENLETLAHLADGGAYPAVRPEVVAATPAVVPDSNVLTAFSRATDSLFAAIAQNERESRTLAALRDALLPKLVSGELRVADADKLVASQA